MMKKTLLVTSLLFLVSTAVTAQFNKNRSVLVTATVSESPAAITLKFPKFTDATRIRVFRKAKEDKDWGNVYANLGTGDSTYTDNAVTVGQAYEYLVFKEGGSTGALGSVYAGINHAAEEQHGTLALVIDNNYLQPLATEITMLEKDLIGDGWQVQRIITERTDAVTAVRDKIKTVPNVKAVFLLGRVPVPYSGSIYPDGHPDHSGAWPCDGYYGDVDGLWTDNIVSTSSASRAENKNQPGDGKFDASQFDSDVDLMVGRVDLSRLPAFAGQSDTALLSYYLQKNHSYRVGQLTAPARALIDDNFQSFTIASSNWRNFAPMVGSANIVDNVNNGVDYNADLKKDWYLWSGACGGGWYSSCSGVINTAQFAADSIKTIFTSLAGSYFGDWDIQDALLRAALASKPSILASFWGGIPNWALHHMALGECIGYGARLTQNENGTLYEGNFNGSQRLIHIALMGDPTLRMHVALAPTTIDAVETGTKKVTVSWAASADANVVGYHVYRAPHLYGKYVKANLTLVNGTSFVDNDPLQGHNVYMVRAVKKETTPSGTYYNLSQGMFDSTDITFPAGIDQLAETNLQLAVYPNPATTELTIAPAGFNGPALKGSLVNLVGQVVRTFAIENGTNTLPIADLPAGIYFIQVQGNGYKGVTKFVKE